MIKGNFVVLLLVVAFAGILAFHAVDGEFFNFIDRQF